MGCVRNRMRGGIFLFIPHQMGNNWSITYFLIWVKKELSKIKYKYLCCHRVSSKYDTQVSYFIGRQFNCFLAEKRMKGRIFFFFWGGGGKWIRVLFNNGLLHLITVSPTLTGWAHNFTSYPWRLNKTAITHEDFKTISSEEYGCTPDEYGSIYPWKLMVLPLKIFTSKEFHIYIYDLDPLSWQENFRANYIYIYIYIYMYFYSTPKKILSLCNLPLKNSICPQPVAGGMDIIMQ